MKRILVFACMLPVAVCLFAGTYSGGNGSELTPYQISNKADLWELSQTSADWISGTYFAQTADIAFDAADFESGGLYYNSGAGFSPIGNLSTPFEGSYDGNERSVSNLHINRPLVSHVGIFGFAANTAQIWDLNILNISINASSNVGALAGKNDGAAISNCSATGSISGTGDKIGGLIGVNYGSINDCSSTCSVNGGSGYTGGLVGANENTILNSYSSGNVSGNGNAIGGLCGHNTGSIDRCYSSGNVSGSGNNGYLGLSIGGFSGGNEGSIAASYCSGTVNGLGRVGGFVGSIYNSSISNCYSLGDIVRLSGSEYVDFGSFCGINTGGSIQYCYSTGSVTYTDNSNPSDKGFVGTIDMGTPTHTGNFFDTGTSGQSIGAGAAAKSTAEMKSVWTFLNGGWDFAEESTNGTEEIWTIASADNGGYPALAWQNCSNDGLFVPHVTTAAVSNITTTSAGSGGDVLSENGSAVTAKGVCWDTSPNPDINDSKTVDGSGAGAFTSSVTGLSAGMTYYLRAYATNSAGTGYGDELSFTAFYFSGSGTPESPFLIGNLDDLRSLSENSDLWDQAYYFLQTADIDAAACSTWNEGAGFSPIGNDVTPFNGNFDGGAYSISNLYIMRTEEYNVALFGWIENSHISNVHLTDAEINNNPLFESEFDSYAILAAYPISSVIENCSAQGTLFGTYYCGLLVGFLDGGRIENCYSSGSINGDEYVGGLVGFNWGGEISNCVNSASVTGNLFVGGLLGTMDEASVTNSYNSGSVNGDEETGGLIGRVSYVNNSVAYCYCSAAVTANTNFGPFIGHLESEYDAVDVSHCFWVVETDGIDGNGSGADNYGATGKSTAEMTNATPVNNIYLLAGWDFAGETANGTEDIWNIGSELNGGYPFLSWEYPEADVPLPVSLTSFSAEVVNGAVNVTWVTESETENAAFRIYRDGAMIAEIEGAGTTAEPHSYTFTDRFVIPGRTYSYQLADVSLDGEETRHNEVKVEVKVEGVDRDYSIGAAYPNPFNPLTIVPLNLAKDVPVRAVLYDVRGYVVKELINGDLSAGSHALKIDGANLSTGIYFVHVNVNNATHVQKIALMK